MKIIVLVLTLVYNSYLLSENIFQSCDTYFNLQKMEFLPININREHFAKRKSKHQMQKTFGKNGNMVFCMAEVDSLIAISSTDIHPVIKTFSLAYNQHRPIIITPDILWYLIMDGLASQIKDNAEKYRDKFVTFEKGKEKVKVTVVSDPKWDRIVDRMVSQIFFKIKDPEFIDIVTTKFSTSTRINELCKKTVVMDAMSKYLNYEARSLCGIPEIKLEGKTEDWQKIYDNIKILDKYNLVKWRKTLEPIIQQFIEASKNNIDLNFWKSIFKYKDRSGCGDGTLVTGWILTFFLNTSQALEYIEVNPIDADLVKKKWKEAKTKSDQYNFFYREYPAIVRNCAREWSSLKEFDTSLTKVDFIYDGKDMTFCSGFVGISQDKMGRLKTEFGFFVKESSVDWGEFLSPVEEEEIEEIKDVKLLSE